MYVWGSVCLWAALIALICSTAVDVGRARQLNSCADSLVHCKHQERPQGIYRGIALIESWLPWVTPLLLTVSIALMLFAFVRGDVTFAYVAHNMSYTDSPLHPLFVVAGLWAGREGSLLFWTWCIAGALATVMYKYRHNRSSASQTSLDAQSYARSRALHRYARAVVQMILMAFVMILVVSPTNNPFGATEPAYLGENNTLVGQAALWGMNRLLEHWAMALHPPTLFVGYAGMTIPFAYATASLLLGDVRSTWIVYCRRFTLIAWVFLTMGIGLGSVWAYEVLGWGGFWGWDAVENASLLSWLTCTAMLHTMYAYRTHHAMRVWTYALSALTLVLVILGTFITRSGLVQSVHAFAADNLSTVSFLLLMLAVVGVMVVLLIRSRHLFGDAFPFTSFASKHFLLLLFCIIMTAAAVLVAYLTLTPALPHPLPLAASVMGKGSFEVVARPVGAVVLILLALCPLMMWRHNSFGLIERRLLAPLCISAACTLPFVWVFLNRLMPIYEMNRAHGGLIAQTLTAQGPRGYYFALALCALFAAVFVVVTSVISCIQQLKHQLSLRVISTSFHAQTSCSSEDGEALVAVSDTSLGDDMNDTLRLENIDESSVTTTWRQTCESQGLSGDDVEDMGGVAPARDIDSLPVERGQGKDIYHSRIWMVLHQFGVSCAHLGIGLIALGLVGSSMFVFERSIHMEADATYQYDVAGYTLSYQGDQMDMTDNGDAVYQVNLLLQDAHASKVVLSPHMTVPTQMSAVQGQQLKADIVSYLFEDVFVAFQGINSDNTLAINVTINPLIRFVWVGIGALILGGVSCALSSGRRSFVTSPFCAADTLSNHRLRGEERL